MKPTIFNQSQEYENSVEKKILSLQKGEREVHQKILSQIVERAILNTESSLKVPSTN